MGWKVLLAGAVILLGLEGFLPATAAESLRIVALRRPRRAPLRQDRPLAETARPTAFQPGGVPDDSRAAPASGEAAGGEDPRALALAWHDIEEPLRLRRRAHSWKKRW